jgi:hypothetical protein
LILTQTQWLLLPAFVHFSLTMYVLFRAGSGRVKAVRSGVVKRSEIDTNKNAYPESVRNFANNYQNQFELPVLYYVALGFLLVTGLVDAVAIVLSWVFVASRLAHSFVQTGNNVISTRFNVFLFGMLCLMALWGWFGIRLFVIG